METIQKMNRIPLELLQRLHQRISALETHIQYLGTHPPVGPTEHEPFSEIPHDPYTFEEQYMSLTPGPVENLKINMFDFQKFSKINCGLQVGNSIELPRYFPAFGHILQQIKKKCDIYYVNFAVNKQFFEGYKVTFELTTNVEMGFFFFNPNNSPDICVVGIQGPNTRIMYFRMTNIETMCFFLDMFVGFCNIYFMNDAVPDYENLYNVNYLPGILDDYEQYTYSEEVMLIDKP